MSPNPGLTDTLAVTVEDLYACDPEGQGTRADATAALKRNLEKLNLTHVKALFAGRKLAYSTTLIMVVWGLIGRSSTLAPHQTFSNRFFRSRLPSL